MSPWAILVVKGSQLTSNAIPIIVIFLLFLVTVVRHVALTYRLQKGVDKSRCLMGGGLIVALEAEGLLELTQVCHCLFATHTPGQTDFLQNRPLYRSRFRPVL